MLKVTGLAASRVKANAFLVGVDKARKAPGLKALGLEGEPNVAGMLANKEIPLPWKTVRSVSTAKGWVLLCGLGDTKALTQEKVGTLANLAARSAGGLGVKVAATTLVADCRLDARSAAQAVTQGVLIGALDFDQWKSKKEEREAEAKGEPKPNGKLDELQVVLPPGSKANAARRAIERSVLLSEAVNDSRLMSNTPANIATPAWLAQQAASRGKANGFKVQVKGRAELRREGYNALCGVGQGSHNEEQLITMDYHSKGARKTLVVVGKGVCFDSGGISLKPGDKMWEMKYDKVGACNTIALMAVLKRLGVRHRVVGIVAAVENMPSGTAQRPGDIVTAKDGTTIEVLNTDAEGRLILADALTHARTFDPAWMVDMATLTGACDIAVGPTYVAVMSNRDAFARSLVAASRSAGDKAWHLPQGEEYDEANKGTYADLQNISLSNRAGTCIGGSFLKHFAKETPWAHLDIASKAWASGGMDYFGKGPTAAGLRIVLERILTE
ncbi:MAG TPA: leucyl aminopeptidase [Candidatus Thermoplasmatota archaeon]|nr:leucyl aminopeptidase [Candidatus Thermoplasmatota archaeon]